MLFRSSKRQTDFTTSADYPEDNDPANAPRYVIYASETYPVDTTKPENIIAQSVRGTEYVYTSLLPWDRKKYFAVTAIDRYGNEGKAIQER